MKTLLINTLEQVCPNNIYLQGTLSADVPYPNEFITFWAFNTDDNAHYDDEVHSVDWYFNVMVYANDPDRVKALSDAARAALKAAGFIPQGKGNDLASDVPTHTGWAMEYVITEII